MKRLPILLAVSCFALAPVQAQEPPAPADAPAPAPTPQAENAPKLHEAVDISETAPPENLEIPVPPESPAPANSSEITEPLPGDEKPPQRPPVAETIALTKTDTGKTVRAKIGDLVSITLPSEPSAGYNWELRDFESNVAGYHSGETLPIHDGNVLLGAPAQTVMTLQALKPGTQDIKLVYRRLWEPPDRIADTFVFRLEVAETPTPTPAAP